MRTTVGKEVVSLTADGADTAIEVRGLCKSYGEIRALENVDFIVRSGEIFGYLGPNGAGKTTTINILSGLLDRDAGDLVICGLDIVQDPVAVKRRIGVVPEESNLYPELSCRRNLHYLGELYGLSRDARRRRTDELLAAFDLSDKKEAPFRTLSRGMKRRLTVAAALIHSPEVLFLDEPTAGLDVPSARVLRTLIQTINRDGTTVFLTTHNLAEAEALCGRILILVKGHTVTEGSTAEIRKRVDKARTLSVVFSGDVEKESLLKACPAVRSTSSAEGTWRLEASDPHAAVAQIISFAEQQGLRVLEIGTSTTSLEDAFMTILKGSIEKSEGGP